MMLFNLERFSVKRINEKNVKSDREQIYKKYNKFSHQTNGESDAVGFFR